MNNEAVVKKMYEDFIAGKIPDVLAAFDPKIEWREADNFVYADGNPYIGPENVLNGVFMKLGTEWDFGLELDETHAAGEKVFGIGRYKGKFKATGKSVDAQFVHVWTLKDGKAVKFQQYTDTLQFHRAVS